MRQIGKLAIQSTFGKIDSLKIDNSFEVFKYIQLFGLDFMIDEDFKGLKDGLKKKEITPELLLEKFKIFNSNLK